MNAQKPQKSIQKKKPRIALKPARCVLAVPAALLSTLSVSVFCFMRSSEKIAEYYSGELSSLLRDSVSLMSLLPLALLFVFYAAAFHRLGRPRLVSAVVALLLAFGMVVSLSMEHSELSEIFLPTDAAGNALVLLGFALLLYTCVELIYLACDRKTQYRIWADELDASADMELFLGAAGCILLCWLPILFMCYPGSIHNDTRYQIMGWLGLKPITASHPILTTVIYGLLYQAGMSMGGQEKALFLNIMFQAALNAATMGLTVVYVCRYTRSKLWFWATVAFFSVLPVWQSAAQVILKDVLHTGCFLFFTCVYLDCLRKREKSWRNVLLLLLTAILVAYTRKATFYLAVICILTVALYHRRTFLMPYLGMLVVFIGLFLFSNNVLYPWLNISGEWESENYSLQFQQVALYCRTYQDEMTPEEIAVIDGTLDFDTIVEEYTPMISDNVKGTFHDEGQGHDDFWQLYRQMVKKHPMLFVKATIMGSFEHFNPWYDGVNYRVHIARQEDFITVDYKSDLHATLNELWNDCLEIPVIRMLIGTGLYAWILLIALGYSIRKKCGLAFFGLMPSLVLLIGLFMSHVNGEIRYGYPLIAAAPLNFAWVLYASSRNAPENPNRARARLGSRETFGFELFKHREEEPEGEEFDPTQPQPDILPPEEPYVAFDGYTPGPVLGFLTQYMPIPKAPKTYLDFLKILAIFLVLWNHTGNGYELYNKVLDMPQHLLYLCASIFDKVAVPLFFMASGALLLGREESYRTILRHRVKRFALILLIVSIISYVYYYRSDSFYSLNDFAVRLYTARILTPLWYLYSYLAFLLMLPFLRKLARGMREQDYVLLVVMFLVTQLIAVADYFWFRGRSYHSSDFVLFTSVSYVVYSLCGFYIDRVMPKKRLNLEGLTVLTMSSVLAIGASYLLTKWKMAPYQTWSADNSQTFFNTFIVIPSITLFYGAKLWFTRYPASGRTAAIFAHIANGTFGTYLFERYWRDKAWFVYEALTDRIGPFAASLVHVLVACVFGILATLLYKLLLGVLKDLRKPKGAVRVRRRRKKRAINFTVPTEDISDLEEMEILLVNSAKKNGNSHT